MHSFNLTLVATLTCCSLLKFCIQYIVLEFVWMLDRPMSITNLLLMEFRTNSYKRSLRFRHYVVSKRKEEDIAETLR